MSIFASWVIAKTWYANLCTTVTTHTCSYVHNEHKCIIDQVIRLQYVNCFPIDIRILLIYYFKVSSHIHCALRLP